MIGYSGVTSLRALLAREKDEDAPRLLTLLCEAFVAVYTSLLCYAMAACDSHVLYRYAREGNPKLECCLIFLGLLFSCSLCGLQPADVMWGSVFGGGTKQLVRITTSAPQSQGSFGSSTETGPTPQPPGSPSATTAMMDVAKQRVRLHIKLLQQIGSPASVGGGLIPSCKFFPDTAYVTNCYRHVFVIIYCSSKHS